MISAHEEGRRRFGVDTTSCAVLVEARSNVGPVTFGTTQVSGLLEVVRSGEHVDTGLRPTAKLIVPLATLTSGNALYDAELHKRLSVQRFPDVTIELVEADTGGGEDYHVSGTVTIHGVTATLHGGVVLSFPEPDTILVKGEHVIDIRDFDIDVPSVLMLRIYPDVKVSLHLLARESLATDGTGNI